MKIIFALYLKTCSKNVLFSPSPAVRFLLYCFIKNKLSSALHKAMTENFQTPDISGFKLFDDLSSRLDYLDISK